MRSATSVYDGRIKFPPGWHASMNEGGTCRRNGSQSTGRGNERLRKRPALRANAKRYLSGFRHRQFPDNNGGDDLHGVQHDDDLNDETVRNHQLLGWWNNDKHCLRIFTFVMFGDRKFVSTISFFIRRGWYEVSVTKNLKLQEQWCCVVHRDDRDEATLKEFESTIISNGRQTNARVNTWLIFNYWLVLAYYASYLISRAIAPEW